MIKEKNLKNKTIKMIKKIIKSRDNRLNEKTFKYYIRGQNKRL